MLRVFIGYDERQPVSLTALTQSIIANTRRPVSITPLALKTLPIQRQGLTPFTYSRFLVPWLCGYQGQALFLDIDVMVRGDLAELFDLCDGTSAVMVSKNALKFEWTSVMLFKCAKCEILTPQYIETAHALHAMAWAEPEEIGELPGEWNHLVGYDPPNPNAKLVHFTQGVPVFPETRDSEFADEWMAYATMGASARPWAELMGASIHAEPVVKRLMAARK